MQELLLAAPWPGNIRQLRSVCRTALALAAPRTHLVVEDLPFDFIAPLGDLGRARFFLAAEREQRMREALEQAHGNEHGGIYDAEGGEIVVNFAKLKQIN